MKELGPAGKKIWGVAVEDAEKRRCCLGESVKTAVDGGKLVVPGVVFSSQKPAACRSQPIL